MSTAEELSGGGIFPSRGLEGERNRLSEKRLVSWGAETLLPFGNTRETLQILAAAADAEIEGIENGSVDAEARWVGRRAGGS